jgi:broad specificity phosphatase PhoE
MTTSLYLVRHGQTAWNKEEVFRGRTDIPLDETGLKEAELAGEYFKTLDIETVYSSPLSRAWQTAQKISRFHSLDVQALEGLLDMSFGSWEGRSLKEVKETDGERYRQWREEPHLLRLPGGETLAEVRARTMSALEEVIRKHPEKTVILVSHRVINKVLICGVLGLDNSHFWQIQQDTTAINLIQHRNGKYILSLMNETCHLRLLQAARTKGDF